MAPSTYPHTTSRVVPVTCTDCRADMTYTIMWQDADHRTWYLHCETCGVHEAEQDQTRHHLWVNNHTVYVGSYWGPADDDLTHTPECNGICITGADLGMPEYGGIAYPHPECELHG